MAKKPTYNLLSEDYNRFAKDIAKFTKKHNKLKEKLLEIDEEFQIILNRIVMYTKNEFWNKYNYKKYTFLIAEEESAHQILFIKKDEFEVAHEKYEAMQEDKKDILEDDFCFGNSDDEEENVNDIINFIQENVSKIYHKCPINYKQENTIKSIIQQVDQLEDKQDYIKEIMKEFETDYNDCMGEVFARLEMDNECDFNIDTDELITILDDKTMTWRLAYYHLDIPEDNNDTEKAPN